MSVAWIRADALDEVRRHARDRHPLEAGGLLLGWTDDATGDAVVAAIVGPGPAAKHGRTSFLPDHDWQRAELARRHAGSGRVHVYLGDWHTHPSGSGRPSGRDRGTLALIAAAPLALPDRCSRSSPAARTGPSTCGATGDAPCLSSSSSRGRTSRDPSSERRRAAPTTPSTPTTSGWSASSTASRCSSSTKMTSVNRRRPSVPHEEPQRSIDRATWCLFTGDPHPGRSRLRRASWASDSESVGSTPR